MGDSPSEEDIERVERDYVDPESVSRDDVQQDLREAGIEGKSGDVFSEGMVTVDEVVDAVDTSVGSGERKIATREDVQDALNRTSDPRSGTRDDSLVSSAAQDIGAPSRESLDSARAEALQRLEGDTLRSSPELDPLGGSDGREIDLSETGMLGKEGGLNTGVDPAGEGKGIYYAEDSSGNRYPLAEVDL